MPLVEDVGGNMGYHVAPWFTSVERCIALAWCHRHPTSGTALRNARPSVTPYAKWLSWTVTEDLSGEDGTILGEVWHEMTGTRAWRCGIVRCGAGYNISNHGRLRSPSGAVTRGFYYDGRRWAAVRGGGLVDLSTCARMRDNVVYLSPCIRQAADALGSGHTPNDLARATGVQLSSAWTYFTTVAQHMDAATLRLVVPGFVARDLWAFLMQMRAEADARLGGPLVLLMMAVRHALSSRGEFKRNTNAYDMNELRLVRLAVAAQKCTL